MGKKAKTIGELMFSTEPSIEIKSEITAESLGTFAGILGNLLPR